MKKNYDVIVIGAGTAGMMAAIAASMNGARVALFEKNKRLGKKLLMTGGGRCNVTNNRPVEDLVAHIPGNGRFLYSVFSQWNNQDIMAFFQERGVALKEEDHGRMFPVTNKAKTIVEALENELNNNGVDILYQTTAQKLIYTADGIQGVRTEEGDFSAKSVIITTGGMTYPSTGATGDGYRMAKALGHHVTPLYPTESPILLDEPFIQEKTLQGLSLQEVRLSVHNEKGKELAGHEMDLLFTHFGVSGPAALRCSSFVNQQLKKQDRVTLQLDCFPQKSKDSLKKELTQLAKDSSKQLKNALTGILPERLLLFFLTQIGIADATFAQIKEQDFEHFLTYCKAWKFSAKGTFGLERSFVTGGGIDLKELQPKTMESKKITGLFFAGEILDVNGYTGGYNITAAFCTGQVAGTHAAYHALSQ